jgi:hypothetical protein
VDCGVALALAFPRGYQGGDLDDGQRALLQVLVDAPDFWRRNFYPKPTGLPYTRWGLRRLLGQSAPTLTAEEGLRRLEAAVQKVVAAARARQSAPAARPAAPAHGNPARTRREAVQRLAENLFVRTEGVQVSAEERRQVESLDLTGHGADAVLAHLGRVPALRCLNLKNSDVTDEGLVYLSAVPGLRDLDLRGTAVTAAGLPHLARLASLESLRLSDTQVSAADVPRLAGAPLRWLWLCDGLKVEGVDVAALVRALPSLERINGKALGEVAKRAAWDNLFGNA